MPHIPSPPVNDDHPDRYTWCQFSLHREFEAIATRAVAAGWDEREVASALVDLADNHMLGLITTGEVDAMLKAIKKCK